MKIVEKRPAIEMFDGIVNRWKEQLMQGQTDTNELVFRLRDFVQTELDINRIKSNRWIPCSERFPENRCGVIFTVDRWHPFVCVGYRINSEREGLKLQRWFDKLSGLNFSDYDVKAWMPMPDAYEPPEKE